MSDRFGTDQPAGTRNQNLHFRSKGYFCMALNARVFHFVPPSLSLRLAGRYHELEAQHQ